MRNLDGVLFKQNFGRQRRSEVGISGPDQLDSVLPYAGVLLAVRGTTSSLVDQRFAAHLPDISPAIERSAAHQR